MRNGEDSDLLRRDFVHYGIGEVLEVIVPGSGIVFGPIDGRGGESVNGVK